MNRISSLALTLVLAAAGNAFADDITIDPHPFVSTASRAQVMDELRQFRQAGASPWADDYNQLADFRSGTTRADVMAEFHRGREATAALTAEDSGSSYLARMHVPAAGRGTALARME